MKNKNINNLELSTILGHTDEHINEKSYVFQSSSFKLIFSFINLYAFIIIALFFLVKGNLIEGINWDFLDQGYLSVLNTRSILVSILVISLNISIYFNYGFKCVCLVLLVFMINGAIDNATLFSNNMHLIDRPYFAIFNVTRPLFIIALFWVFMIHKDKKKSQKKV